MMFVLDNRRTRPDVREFATVEEAVEFGRNFEMDVWQDATIQGNSIAGTRIYNYRDEEAGE